MGIGKCGHRDIRGRDMCPHPNSVGTNGTGTCGVGTYGVGTCGIGTYVLKTLQLSICSCVSCSAGNSSPLSLNISGNGIACATGDSTGCW